MIPQLTYQYISALSQVNEIKSILSEYLTVVCEMMKNLYQDYPYALEFNVDDEKYIFIQKGEIFTIGIGFFWDIQDLYFGMKIHVPFEINTIDTMPFDTNWSYGKEGNKNSYSQLVRYADFMVVGCSSVEYIDVLNKFKEIANSSIEIVEIAKENSQCHEDS